MDGREVMTFGAPAEQAAGALPDTLPIVRRAVRDFLMDWPEYRSLDPDRRRQVASLMVTVCHRAADLIQEHMESDADAQRVLGPGHPAVAQGVEPASGEHGVEPAAGEDGVEPAAGEHGVEPAGDAHGAAEAPGPLARAQARFDPQAARQVAGTTRRILNAVSFPRFVTDLINGVFKAVTDSSMQQMDNFISLLNNVATSSQGFADRNMAPARARQFLADTFPDVFEVVGGGGDDELGGFGDGGGGRFGGGRFGGFDDLPDEVPDPGGVLRLRAGASYPSEDALRSALGLGANDPVPTGDPERVLVPLARRKLAEQRQQMLATMVQMGLQRIVIDSGRIQASMRFHIDTRSAAQEDRGSSFDFRNQVSAAGSFGYGPWGASASMTNTIGYVSTQQTQTTEEMNVDLNLNSSVEVNFRTDYVPLNRLAAPGQLDSIRQHSRNPQAEEQAAASARQARQTQARQSEEARRTAVRQRVQPPSSSAPAPATGRETLDAAERARTGTSPGSGSGAGSGSQRGTGSQPRTSPGGSQPATSGGSRTTTPGGSQPPASGGAPPSTSGGSQPTTSGGSRPTTPGGSQPTTSGGAPPPTSGGSQAPASGGSQQTRTSGDAFRGGGGGQGQGGQGG